MTTQQWKCVRCGVLGLSIPRHDDLICEWCAKELEKSPIVFTEHTPRAYGDAALARPYMPYVGDTIINAVPGYRIQHGIGRERKRPTLKTNPKPEE